MVGRAEALACNFFLLGLLLYMRGVSTGRGNKLAVTKKTKWPYLLLSIMMSMLAMLSKEQGVTVLGVCAAFDVFINWDVINSNLWTRKKDKESTTSEEKSKTFNDGSTNSNRHLDGSNNCRNSHINGLSIKSIPGKNKKLHGVGLEIHSLILRIGMGHKKGKLFLVSVYSFSSSSHCRVSTGEWSRSSLAQDVNELWYTTYIQTI